MAAAWKILYLIKGKYYNADTIVALARRLDDQHPAGKDDLPLERVIFASEAAARLRERYGMKVTETRT